MNVSEANAVVVLLDALEATDPAYRTPPTTDQVLAAVALLHSRACRRLMVSIPIHEGPLRSFIDSNCQVSR